MPKWNNTNPITIVIFGASGDLAQRKLIPALFNLYCKGRLPAKTQIMYGLCFYADEFIGRDGQVWRLDCGRH